MKLNMLRLDEFCDSVRDGTHDTPQKVDNGYKLITAKHINNTGIDFSEAYFISEKDYNHINERSKVEKWDVLMSMIGNGLGKTYLVSNNPDYAIKNLALFKIGEEYKAKWLHYYLSSSIGQNLIYSKLQGTGQPFVSLSFLRKMKIPVPDSYCILCKITSILSAYDNLIENNNRRIRLLEQMAENLYKEWFVRFRFPGYENAEFENGLPKGWKIEKIGNVSETIGGGTPSTGNPAYWDGDIKWVTPSDITSKNSLPLLKVEGRISEEGLKKSSAKLLPPYTILMTSRASIGYFGIAPFEVCTNQGFISIIPQKENLRMYMLYTLKLKKDEIIANANGSTFLEISKGRFRKMKMVVPIDSILDLFENKTRVIFDEILKIEQQSENLARQRDLLLPRLMSGKLEVNV